MTEQAAPQKESSWKQMLAATPLRNTAARAIENGDELRIEVPTKKPRWFVPPISWVVPLRPTRTVRLDRVGATVWRQCDGERTVEELVGDFARQYNLTFHEARVAVTSYLRQLVQRGALAIEMPADEAQQ